MRGESSDSSGTNRVQTGIPDPWGVLSWSVEDQPGPDAAHGPASGTTQVGTMQTGTQTGTMQIGAVAARTGLSLRSIRWYEEVGLIGPTSRSPGGFRLYTEADVARIGVIMQMKPLDFSLEDMRDLLGLLDDLTATPDGDPARAALLDRLGGYRSAVEERIRTLHDRLAVAEGFARRLASA